MKLLRLFLISLLLTIGCASAHAQTFPKLTGRVVDAANLLSPEQEAQLSQMSAQIEQASGRQFVVATIPDLQGYEIDQYGYQLGRAWKIGQKGANNGIILLVAPNERRVRIEVGYGLEPIMTDALSGMIVDNIILPRFRDGDMAGGILAGAQAISEQMKLPLEAAEKRAQEQLAKNKATAEARQGDGNWGVAIFWVVIILFVVLPMMRRGAHGRRYRRGGGIAPVILWGPGFGSGGSHHSGGGFGGFGGGGGFSGGGGSFGGGGASGGW